MRSGAAASKTLGGDGADAQHSVCGIDFGVQAHCLQMSTAERRRCVSSRLLVKARPEFLVFGVVSAFMEDSSSMSSSGAARSSHDGRRMGSDAGSAAARVQRRYGRCFEGCLSRRQSSNVCTRRFLLEGVRC